MKKVIFKTTKYDIINARYPIFLTISLIIHGIVLLVLGFFYNVFAMECLREKNKANLPIKIILRKPKKESSLKRNIPKKKYKKLVSKVKSIKKIKSNPFISPAKIDIPKVYDIAPYPIAKPRKLLISKNNKIVDNFKKNRLKVKSIRIPIKTPPSPAKKIKEIKEKTVLLKKKLVKEGNSSSSFKEKIQKKIILKDSGEENRNDKKVASIIKKEDKESLKPSLVSNIPKVKDTKKTSNLPCKPKKATGSENREKISFSKEDILNFRRVVSKKVERVKLYPVSARENNIEGKVVVIFTIIPSGGIESIDIALSSNSLVLDKAALSAVKRGAPYLPYPKGLKRPIRVRLKVNFYLRN